MGDDLIEGIVLKIREQFPQDQYQIYTEQVEQGLQVPCFFVLMNQSEIKRQVGKRFLERYLITVQFFPEDSPIIEKNQAALQVSQKLLDLLEVVPLGDGSVRGRNLKADFLQDRLQIFAQYQFYTIEVPPQEEYMENLKIKNYSKFPWKS